MFQLRHWDELTFGSLHSCNAALTCLRAKRDRFYQPGLKRLHRECTITSAGLLFTLFQAQFSQVRWRKERPTVAAVSIEALLMLKGAWNQQPPASSVFFDPAVVVGPFWATKRNVSMAITAALSAK